MDARYKKLRLIFAMQYPVKSLYHGVKIQWVVFACCRQASSRIDTAYVKERAFRYGGTANAQ